MSSKFYSEKVFAIDIISDIYKTTNPEKIQKESKELLDIYLSISEIKDYFNYTEDFEKESYTISMKQIF